VGRFPRVHQDLFTPEAPEGLNRTRIRLVGTGALASLLGARLARAGFHVTLAGSWPQGLDAISSRGIAVDDEDKTFWSVPVRAVPLRGPLEPADAVLVVVKSYQTATIAPHCARELAPGALIVTFQNGLGNREILAAHAGAARVVQGIATLGATLLGPGHIRAQKGALLLGTAPGVQELAALLRAAQLESRVSHDIETALWRKLAVNCAINPLSALLGVENGALLKSLQARERLGEAAREVARVAEARGTPLGEDAALLAESVAERTAENRSSMLQDLDRGFPTEIEALNGALVAEGERLGIPTPVNTALLAALRQREGRSPEEATRP
jgi:2-dehydropantoate 2-reductase